MSKLPSMPFFPADFFADTAHISGEAAAVYLVLLGHAWLRGGDLPCEDRMLARLARISGQKWVALRGEVLPFFTQSTGGLLHQKRLTRDIDRVRCTIQNQSERGIKGNAKRWGQKHLDFNRTSIPAAIAEGSLPDRNQNHNQNIKDSFNNGLRQESGNGSVAGRGWVPTKRIGDRTFKAGEHAPKYPGQDPARWEVLKPEDCH